MRCPFFVYTLSYLSPNTKFHYYNYLDYECFDAAQILDIDMVSEGFKKALGKVLICLANNYGSDLNKEEFILFRKKVVDEILRYARENNTGMLTFQDLINAIYFNPSLNNIPWKELFNNITQKHILSNSELSDDSVSKIINSELDPYASDKITSIIKKDIPNRENLLYEIIRAANKYKKNNIIEEFDVLVGIYEDKNLLDVLYEDIPLFPYNIEAKFQNSNTPEDEIIYKNPSISVDLICKQIQEKAPSIEWQKRNLEQTANFDIHIKEFIMNYISYSYNSINENLRTSTPYRKNLILNDAIDTMEPLEKDIYVIRYIKGDFLPEKGDFRSLGYLSTSINYAAYLETIETQNLSLMRIKVPRGNKAILVSNPNEMELIFKHDIILEVVKHYQKPFEINGNIIYNNWYDVVMKS